MSQPPFFSKITKIKNHSLFQATINHLIDILTTENLQNIIVKSSNCNIQSIPYINNLITQTLSRQHKNEIANLDQNSLISNSMPEISKFVKKNCKYKLFMRLNKFDSEKFHKHLMTQQKIIENKLKSSNNLPDRPILNYMCNINAGRSNVYHITDDHFERLFKELCLILSSCTETEINIMLKFVPK